TDALTHVVRVVPQQRLDLVPPAQGHETLDWHRVEPDEPHAAGPGRPLDTDRNGFLERVAVVEGARQTEVGHPDGEHVAELLRDVERVAQHSEAALAVAAHSARRP